MGMHVYIIVSYNNINVKRFCPAPGRLTRGGTHPRKVRVGSAAVVKMKLYLYKCAKKGGLFYIFAAKKWGLFYTFLTKIEVKVGKFARNLGKNQYFGVKSWGKNWNCTENRGLFYMKAESWGIFYTRALPLTRGSS